MALLPLFFPDTVVAIGAGEDPTKRRWIGTGFLFGQLITPVVDVQLAGEFRTVTLHFDSSS